MVKSQFHSVFITLNFIELVVFLSFFYQSSLKELIKLTAFRASQNVPVIDSDPLDYRNTAVKQAKKYMKGYDFTAAAVQF